MSGREHIQGAIDRMKETVKHGKLKIKRGKLKERILKDSNSQIPDYERDRICKAARKTAHSMAADAKREVSKQVRKDLSID